MEIFNFNADTLFYISTVIGIGVVSLVIYGLKWLAKKTKNTFDDMLVDSLEEMHKENLKKIKK